MKSTKLIASIAISLALISCSSDPEEQQIEREEVRFQSNTITVDPQTRATLTFDENKEFKILVRDKTSTYFDTQKILTAKAAAAADGKNALATTPTIYWDDLGGRNADLKLFGLYQNDDSKRADDIVLKSGETDIIEWTVSNNQSSSGVDVYDLITSEVSSYKYADRTNPANLEFKHRMAKVSVVLYPDGGGYSLTDLENATVTYECLPTGAAEFDITKATNPFDLSLTVVDEIKPCKFEVKDGNNDLEAYAFTVITYPSSAVAGAKLATINLGGNDYEIKLDAATNFSAGVHTSYKVTIKKTGITVTANLVDWTPAPYEKSASLITVEDFAITAPSGITLGDNTTVTLKITGSGGTSDTQTAKFTYNDGTGKWAVTQAAYWDDLKRPITKIEGLLLNGGSLDTGEECFTGISTTSHDLKSRIPLTDFFSHPLSKVSILVRTSTGTDKVNISTGITSITIPGCGKFTEGSDGVSIVHDGNTTDITKTGVYAAAQGDGSGVGDGNTPAQYACGPFYFFPQPFSRLFAITIKETIDVVEHTNTYYVDFSPAQAFEAGKHYTYTVTILKTGVTFSGTLKDWIEDPKDNQDIYL